MDPVESATSPVALAVGKILCRQKLDARRFPPSAKMEKRPQNESVAAQHYFTLVPGAAISAMVRV
jgi:hypothetical protein